MLIETSLLSGDWHRVEVTHVSGTKITCYFIDHGDEDLFGAEDLRAHVEGSGGALMPGRHHLAPEVESRNSA